MLEGNFASYDIEVELTLFSSEEGGRQTGIPSNSYGPHIVVNGYEWHAYFILQDREILNPGETAHVFVTFFFPELVKDLYDNQIFFLHEGYHPIGKGRVLSMLNFENHVKEAIKQKEDRDILKNEMKLDFKKQRNKHKKKKRS
jgi:hypothetical protein